MTGSLNVFLAATALFVLGQFLLSSLPMRQALTVALVRLLSGLADFMNPAGSGNHPSSNRKFGAGGGAGTFRLLYVLFALVTFVWMLQAYRAAPALLLWDLPLELAWVPVLVMPLALFLAVAGLTTTSPTMVGGEARLTDRSGLNPAPGILGVTRHPFLWGTSLWAAS